jgi:FdhD protein
VIGHALLQERFPLDRCVLLVSGRSSFEIMQKALAGRVPVVAAVSAPSSLAVQFAEESGQTLVGFLRERKMNLYSRPERMKF